MKRFASFLLVLNLSSALAAGICSGAQQPQPAQGMYEIVSAADSGYVLDLAGCTSSEEYDFSTLQLYRTLDINQQKFYLEQEKGDSWRLSSLLNGNALCWQKENQEEESDTILTMEPLEHKAGAAAPQRQLWTIESAGDGSYYVCTADGQYLGLESSRTYNGASIVLADKRGDSSQRWIFRKTWLSSQACADTDLINPYETDGRYEDLSIILRFKEFGKEETIDHETIASWYTLDEETHTMQQDTDAIEEYVADLASQYNTVGMPKTFTSSNGHTFPLFKGNYGWELNESETMGQILSVLSYNSPVIISPVWNKTAAEPVEGNDVGDSYVEVDLTNQKVWLYKDGKLLLETDCVSGTYGTDRQTPGGIYTIAYKQSPAVLTGPGYSSPVSYWMPFNGGIGLHDATWRGSFGGDIFRTNGSHGCVNLPYNAAQKIYETVSKGYPVVCYN